MSDIPLIDVYIEELNIWSTVVPAAELVKHFGPRVLPPNWRLAPIQSTDGVYWTFEPQFGRQLKVLMSAAIEGDRRLWLHVSVSKWSQSRKTMEPVDWDDHKLVKDLFLGPDREAYVVLPKQSRYVNLREVYHLFALAEGEALPDFTRGTGSL